MAYMINDDVEGICYEWGAKASGENVEELRKWQWHRTLMISDLESGVMVLTAQRPSTRHTNIICKAKCSTVGLKNNRVVYLLLKAKEDDLYYLLTMG